MPAWEDRLKAFGILIFQRFQHLLKVFIYLHTPCGSSPMCGTLYAQSINSIAASTVIPILFLTSPLLI